MSDARPPPANQSLSRHSQLTDCRHRGSACRHRGFWGPSRRCTLGEPAGGRDKADAAGQLQADARTMGRDQGRDRAGDDVPSRAADRGQHRNRRGSDDPGVLALLRAGQPADRQARRHVERGAPLLAVEATEFVQAQNDLVTAAAALERPRARSSSWPSRRAAPACALCRQGRRAQGLAAEPGRSDRRPERSARAEIALAAVRNRLRILGKSDAEIAAARERRGAEDRSRSPIVVAPIGGTVTQRQVGLGQYITSQSGASTPVLHDRRSVDRLAGRQRAREPMRR